MRTLADLKRNASKYTWTMTKNTWGAGKLIGLKRTVARTQTNSIAFFTDVSKSGVSWLEWPKAKDITITPLENGAFNLHIENKDDAQECILDYRLEVIE